MHIYKLSLIAVVFVVFACNDDHLEPKAIITGDYKKMNIIYIDTLIAGSYHQEVFFDIDLDNNGQADIRLLSNIFGSPGMGMHPESKIMSLHSDALLLGFFKYDTLFLETYIDTVDFENNVEIREYKTQSYTGKQFINYNNRTCEIQEIFENQFKIKQLDNNEPIFEKDDFKTDTIVLSEWWLNDMAYIEDKRTDTIKYIHNSYGFDNSLFQMNKICYIGVLLKNEKRDRLGWIKFLIVDDYRIYIFETALEQK